MVAVITLAIIAVEVIQHSIYFGSANSISTLAKLDVQLWGSRTPNQAMGRRKRKKKQTTEQTMEKMNNPKIIDDSNTDQKTTDQKTTDQEITDQKVTEKEIDYQEMLAQHKRASKLWDEVRESCNEETISTDRYLKCFASLINDMYEKTIREHGSITPTTQGELDTLIVGTLACEADEEAINTLIAMWKPYKSNLFDSIESRVSDNFRRSSSSRATTRIRLLTLLPVLDIVVILIGIRKKKKVNWVESENIKPKVLSSLEKNPSLPLNHL